MGINTGPSERAYQEGFEDGKCSQENGARELPFDRDTLGRFVREAWVRWAEHQPNAKPSWLVDYDQLDEADKEADRHIGESVARWVLIGDALRASLNKYPFVDKKGE